MKPCCRSECGLDLQFGYALIALTPGDFEQFVCPLERHRVLTRAEYHLRSSMSNRQPETEPVQSFAYLSLFLVGSSLASLRGARCRGGDPGYAAAYSTSQVRSLFTRSVDRCGERVTRRGRAGGEGARVSQRQGKVSVDWWACVLAPVQAVLLDSSLGLLGHRTPDTDDKHHPSLWWWWPLHTPRTVLLINRPTGHRDRGPSLAAA